MTMRFDKYNIQTLEGMTLNALNDHYEKVKADYMQLSGRDVRMQAYLQTVNGFIQMRSNETEARE